MTIIQDYSFIQFYTPSRYDTYIDLGNGFSDTLDFCKSKGEVFWLEHKGLMWASTYKILNGKAELEKFEDIDIPLKTKNILVSALYTTHLYQALVWAKKYPEINFIVGGPAVISNLFILTEQLPNNLILTTKSVEDFFNLENFSYKWKIDIPITGEVVFAYTIDTSCYWGNCIYCNFTFCKNRVRKELEFEFKDINYNEHKIIRINTSSIRPNQIRNILPKLPRLEKTRYDLYLRFGNEELKALEDIKEHCSDLHIRFLVGIEFPSEKMLTFINKGITEKEIYNMLNLMKDQHSWECLLFIILGWEELENSDLQNLTSFIKRVPENCKIAVTRIFARPYTKLYNMYEKDKEQNIGPFHFGFTPKISNKKLELNLAAKEIILSYKNSIDFSRGLI